MHFIKCLRPRSLQSSLGRDGSVLLPLAQWRLFSSKIVPSTDKDVLRILEQAERARSLWDTVWTDFYTPPVVYGALAILETIADITAVPWGGYPQAERQRIALGREEIMDQEKIMRGGVAALDVKGNFIFDQACHRDFLGAILGTGIERCMVGDILIHGESGAHILVAESMVEHLHASLTQVRSVPVTTTSIPLEYLKVPTPKLEHIKSVEKSLRLDAIASAGFRMSRSKMSDLIKKGDIRLNWQSQGIKASTDVSPGDTVSCAGKGRVTIDSVEMTSKGKFVVHMSRLV